MTPEGEIIVIEYAKHTWILPMPGNSTARATTKKRVETLNSFECLTDRDVENDSKILVSDLEQHNRNDSKILVSDLNNTIEMKRHRGVLN